MNPSELNFWNNNCDFGTDNKKSKDSSNTCTSNSKSSFCKWFPKLCEVLKSDLKTDANRNMLNENFPLPERPDMITSWLPETIQGLINNIRSNKNSNKISDEELDETYSFLETLQYSKIPENVGNSTADIESSFWRRWQPLKILTRTYSSAEDQTHQNPEKDLFRSRNNYSIGPDPIMNHYAIQQPDPSSSGEDDDDCDTSRDWFSIIVDVFDNTIGVVVDCYATVVIAAVEFALRNMPEFENNSGGNDDDDEPVDTELK